MPPPFDHAKADVKKFGGKPEDYVKIHEVMDSSKGAVSSNLHRFAYHHSHFTTNILPLIFGHQIVNSDGRSINVKDIGENHCLVDFKGKFIPTLQDYCQSAFLEPWINNGLELSPSAKALKMERANSYDDVHLDGDGQIFLNHEVVGLFVNHRLTIIKPLSLEQTRSVHNICAAKGPPSVKQSFQID